MNYMIRFEDIWKLTDMDGVGEFEIYIGERFVGIMERNDNTLNAFGYMFVERMGAVGPGVLRVDLKEWGC